MKRKITVTTGSRSDYGLLRPVLMEIIKNKKLKLYLIVTGMHLSKKYGLTINEIKNDGFQIDSTVNMLARDDSSFSSTQELGRGIMQFAKVFNKIKPDINLILGDRDESLASALAASHMNILNAHIHGGDKSGGLDEYNRHAITKISNIHFPATKKSRQRIIRMGENPKFVFFTGSPSIDEVLSFKITSKNDLEKKYNMRFKGNEIILLYHPVTTQTNLNAFQVKMALDVIVEIKNTTIAIAPNSDPGNKNIFDLIVQYSKKYDFIKMYSSIPRSDYLGLLKNCGVLVGNSSSGIIEASYFTIPVINIGIRQKSREKGKTIINIENPSIRLLHTSILTALKKKQKLAITESPYGTGNASKKIVSHLERIVINKNLIQKQIIY